MSDATVSDAELLASAEEAARVGGRILLDWADRFTPREKSRFNMVTEADLASEKAIHEFLTERYPDHSYLGEEGLQESGSSEYRWVIDPLDGTGNYVHQFPYYAVSIGLERAGTLIVGAIYDPTRDEMFAASTGAGATKNGQPLQVSNHDELATSMLMASLPVGAGPDNPAVDRFLKAMSKAQTVQRTGSAALNLANVAAGRIEGFWSTSLKPWDMAAGVVIVREAGGRVTTIDGSEFDVNKPDLLATNGTAVHESIIDFL